MYYILYHYIQAGHSPKMLTLQYRMHPTICQWVSKANYNSKLITARTTALARQCSKPCVWMQVSGEEEKHPKRASVYTCNINLLTVEHTGYNCAVNE
jgi:superfamily I DNA and/or RNA helicase